MAYQKEVYLQDLPVDEMEVIVARCSALAPSDGATKVTAYVQWTLNLPDGDVSGKTGTVLHARCCVRAFRIAMSRDCVELCCDAVFGDVSGKTGTVCMHGVVFLRFASRCRVTV